MGIVSRLKAALRRKTMKNYEEPVKADGRTVQRTVQRQPYARIRPLDLLDKLDKLDELSLITIRLDQLKERSSLILESVAQHDNRVLDKLDLLDKLDELSLISDKLDNALSGRVVEAVKEIRVSLKLQEILEVFKLRGILSTKEVSMMFGTTTATESKHLKELEGLGKIEGVRRGVYRLRE